MTAPAPRWRVGRQIPRNLYLGEQDVGRVDTAELAALIVRTMNEAIDRAGHPDRCSDCGRTARELTPWYGDVGNGTEVTAWLGPTCHRRRLDEAQKAAYGGHTCVALTVPIGDAS